MKYTKYQLLKRSIIYDLIGVATVFIPVVGPFLDIVWAPYAAKKMSDMYEGTTGKIAATIVFIEEILPFDFVPTFTLMWLYTFVFKTNDKTSKTIEVEVKN